jgi:hypothetical protein
MMPATPSAEFRTDVSISETYPWFLPGVVASTIVAGFTGRPIGRALSVSPLLGFLLAAAVAVVVSATLLPGAPGSVGSATCDMTRLGLPSWNQLVRPGEILFNILLFVPLGGLIGLLPASPHRLTVVLVAYASPVAIEAIQLVAVPLGRACQSGDVIDNVTGLSVGALAGASVRWLAVLNARGRAGSSPPNAASARRELTTLVVGGVVAVLLLTAAALPPGQTPAPSVATIPTHVPETSSSPRSGEPQPSTGASGLSVRVSTVPALLSSLENDGITEIIVADGRYPVSSAGLQGGDSLWIGSRFADRTQPVTVRAETRGGVTFDGGGANLAWLWFTEGAHDQTWDGFVFANGSPTRTGVIFFGEGGGVAPHDLTFRHITIDRSVVGSAVTASAPAHDHAIYISQALGGPRDLVFEDIIVDGRGGLASAFHFYHSDPPLVNALRVTVRRLEVIGTQQAIMLWDPTLRAITFDTVRITDALKHGVAYEALGATDIILANVTTTGSGTGIGFKSSLGPEPPGLTLINTSFH